MADRRLPTQRDARYALRRTGEDVPLDVRCELLPDGQTKVRDSFCDEPHLVQRYVFLGGTGDVLATWCPNLKIVWWRPHGAEARDGG